MRVVRIPFVLTLFATVVALAAMPGFADPPRTGKSTKGSPAKPGKSAGKAAVSPSDGTVTGTFTLNGKEYPIKYIYARKREAWPSDAKALKAGTAEDLPCGIVETLFTNEPLSEATIASILHNDYQGSPTIRGVRFLSDGSGKYKWDARYLLESGSVEGFGMTQSSGEIEVGGNRYKGRASAHNQDVTQVRDYDLTFDSPVILQYLVTETESAQTVPSAALTDEFVKTLPGTWTVERYTGIGCWYSTGTLEVGERISPHEFQARFRVVGVAGGTSADIEVDGVISLAGTKVHFEAEKILSEDKRWTKDNLDFDMWKDLLVCNTSRFSVVLKKEEPTATQ